MGRISRRPKAKRIDRAKDAAEAMAHRLFRDAARGQKCCAVPGCRNKDFDPHHVIYEQHLKDHGLPKYDTRNVRRLCRHHHQQHHRIKKLPLTILLDENIRYAFLVLGDYAADYLRRYYAGDDPRLEVIAREQHEHESDRV